MHIRLWHAHISTYGSIIQHERSGCSLFTVLIFIFIAFIMYNSGEGIHLLSDKHLLRCVWIIQWALPFLFVRIDPHFVCLTCFIICVCGSVGHLFQTLAFAPSPHIYSFIPTSLSTTLLSFLFVFLNSFFSRSFFLFYPFLCHDPSLISVFLLLLSHQ